jgi:hypothetical protein
MPFDVYRTEFFDKDGYYFFNIYPFRQNVGYIDENGKNIITVFGPVYSEEEWSILLENEIIPLYDDLFARGLITQEEYDYKITFNPLDYFVDMYFN